MPIDLGKAREVAAREDAGTVIHVRDELNEKLYEDGKPVTIRVAGSYSSIYRRAVEANRDKLLKRGRGSLDGDVLDKQSLDLLATCVLGWDNLVVGDQPFPFSKENAKVLLEAAPWIREQVENATQDHAGFFSNA